MFNILILPVDNKPPSVKSGVRVNVGRGRSAAVDDGLLGITDVDTLKEDLQFALMSLPAHGDIVKLTNSFHTVLRAGQHCN